MSTGLDNVPVIGVPKGTLAIWNSGVGGDDDAPAIAPLGFLDKIAFHSALDYLGVVEDLQVEVAFPQVDFVSPVTTTQVLYGHSQGPKPMAISLVSADGGLTWFALNGTNFTNLGNLLLGRSIIVQVDATTFYLRREEIGFSPAQTYIFRTLVLSRTFGTAKVKTNETFFATPVAPATVRANGGLFDTTRRYLQTPAAGQAKLFKHKSGQTITAVDGDESTEIDIFFQNAAFNFTVVANATAANGSPIFALPSTFQGAAILENDLVLEGPGTAPQAIEVSPTRMRIGDSAGADVFDTSRKTLALLAEFNGQFTTSTHPQGTLAGEVPHQFVHATVPLNVPAGAVPFMILGWLEVVSATGVRVVVTSNRPADLSGTVLVAHGIEAVPFGETFIGKYSTVSARINGTSLEIVEEWFNAQVNNENTTDMPSFTFNAHVFACGLLGGF